ncbi:uncharacterized protein LOC110036700 [Phalaenopsis equestris]|uniref:uncharacterized protein LOC110036700 n=1 Tax=Phalaenopsis equestris TaxID=78828 RepID=UPI0009E511E9|nr:uncharacterized protein LOC110036700 [Phalaenopsis equestris]
MYGHITRTSCKWLRRIGKMSHILTLSPACGKSKKVAKAKKWQKQKKVGNALKKLSWTTFGDLMKAVDKAKQELQTLEEEHNKGNIDENSLLEANEKVLAAINWQDQFLTQKTSKTKFTEGDRNTKFYHACINYQRKCNTIQCIKDQNGNRIRKEEEIAESLTDIPEEEEIKKSLLSIDSSKSAGPDGFTADFYKKAWGRSRLQPVLPQLITINQAAFVKGIIIGDQILLAQELLQDLERSCRGGNIIYKLDLKKAYDMVNCELIMECLEARGFSVEFCQTIKRWLEANSNSVLINGKAHGFCQANRGLKQCDPLSPTIFILVLDYLSKLIDGKGKRNRLNVYHNKAKMDISHLISTLYILVFTRATKGANRYLAECLNKFLSVMSV